MFNENQKFFVHLIHYCGSFSLYLCFVWLSNDVKFHINIYCLKLSLWWTMCIICNASIV